MGVRGSMCDVRGGRLACVRGPAESRDCCHNSLLARCMDPYCAHSSLSALRLSSFTDSVGWRARLVELGVPAHVQSASTAYRSTQDQTMHVNLGECFARAPSVQTGSSDFRFAPMVNCLRNAMARDMPLCFETMASLHPHTPPAILARAGSLGSRGKWARGANALGEWSVAVRLASAEMARRLCSCRARSRTQWASTPGPWRPWRRACARKSTQVVCLA